MAKRTKIQSRQKPVKTGKAPGKSALGFRHEQSGKPRIKESSSIPSVSYFQSPKRTLKLAGTVAFAAFVLFSLAYIFTAMKTPARLGKNTTLIQTPGVSGNIPSGACKYNEHCETFGNKYCGGSKYSLCDTNDGLCHCCVSLGSAGRCITCEEINCPSVDRYCMGDYLCVFKKGGLPNA